MNLVEANIKSIEPKAVLTGGLDGSRFIAQVNYANGTTQLVTVAPPEYTPQFFIPIETYILDAALIKHGYEPLENQVLSNDEEYKNFLEKINTTEVE